MAHLLPMHPSRSSSIAQKVAVAALRIGYAGGEAISRMVKAFCERRDILLTSLQELVGMRISEAQSAFYVFIDLSYYYGTKVDSFSLITDSESLCQYLLENGQVVLVVGNDGTWLDIPKGPLGKLIAGLFGPTFQAESSNTSRHLAEFLMIELELAFADLNDDMAYAVAYLQYVNGGEVNSIRRHSGMDVDPSARDNHSGPERDKVDRVWKQNVYGKPLGIENIECIFIDKEKNKDVIDAAIVGTLVDHKEDFLCL
ncbi:bifunctional aspartate aminotransferase and glutamate/aspartate-prephenate aminotransferase [Tanacetum coccineum]